MDRAMIIRQERKRRNLTLHEVAEATGVSVSTVSRIERESSYNASQKDFEAIVSFLELEDKKRFFSQPNMGFIAYEFPVFDAQWTAQLTLPRRLSRIDCERLKAFLDTLVVNEETSS